MVTKIYNTDFKDSFYASHNAVGITSITYQSGSSASTAGGQTMTLQGSNFSAGAQVYINNILVSVSSVVSSTQITFVSPAKSAGTYLINVVTLDGGIGTLHPGIVYS